VQSFCEVSLQLPRPSQQAPILLLIFRKERSCWSIGIMIISPSLGFFNVDNSSILVKYASNATADEPVMT